MKKYNIEDWFIGASVLAVLVSGYVSFFQMDVFNLAGTQWMLIAIVLGIYGLFAGAKKAA